jgi:hypothetical protein
MAGAVVGQGVGSLGVGEGVAFPSIHSMTGEHCACCAVAL